MEIRYWLRGGLIAFALYILLGFLILFLEFHPPNQLSGLGTVLYLVTPGQFILGIDSLLEYVLSLILSIAAYFVLGTILGLIYQRNKSFALSLLFSLLIIAISLIYTFFT